MIARQAILAAAVLATAACAGAAWATDYRAAYMAGVEKCRTLILDAAPFDPVPMLSRDEPIDLAMPNERQRLFWPDGLFSMWVSTLDGRDERVLRFCSLRESGRMPRGEVRAAIQAELRAMAADLVSTGDFIELTADDLRFKPHPESMRLVSCGTNPRGCRMTLTLMLPFEWLEASLGETECTPIPDDERRARRHYPTCDSAPTSEER